MIPSIGGPRVWAWLDRAAAHSCDGADLADMTAGAHLCELRQAGATVGAFAWEFDRGALRVTALGAAAGADAVRTVLAWVCGVAAMAGVAFVECDTRRPELVRLLRRLGAVVVGHHGAGWRLARGLHGFA